MSFLPKSGFFVLLFISVKVMCTYFICSLHAGVMFELGKKVGLAIVHGKQFLVETIQMLS